MWFGVAVIQSLSHVQLCNPMNCSNPGFPVFHHLPELAQTHVHWVHDAIQSSSPVALFSSCPQSFPASGSFLMSQLFTSDGQSIGASASVLPMNIQGWFPLGLTSLISLLSTSLLQHHNLKASVLWCSAFFTVQLSHPHMTTGKAIWIFVGKLMSLLFNMLYKLVIAFLPRSKSSEMEFLWLDYEGKGSFSRKYN